MRRLGNAAALVGLALLVIGGGLRLSRPQWEVARAVVLLLGALCLLFALYANFGLVQELLSRRSARYGLNVALMVLLVIALITLVEAVSYRHNWRLDLTENRRHSLSPQTRKLLQGLKVEIQATAFMRPDQPQKRAAEDLFKQYASFSGGKFSWQIVDPDRNPGLARRYGIQTYGTVVLETKIKDQIKEEKLTGAEEEKLTNGLVRVTREGKRVVYVLSGHGEKSLGSQEREGLSGAKDAMEKANYVVKELLLLRDPKIPEDAAIILVPGPRNDLLPPELQAIDGFIGRAGKVLFMVDPFQARGLGPYLQKYGIGLGDNIAIEVNPIGRLFGAGPEIPVVSEYEDHPITKELRGVATFFPLARSVEAMPKPPGGVNVQALAKTSPQSWGETDQDELRRGEVRPDARDQRGPLTLLTVATVPAKEAPEDRREARARVVVFGTSNIVTNQFLNVQGNRDLFLNTISWLAEEEDLIAVRPKESRSTPVFLTALQGQLLFWVPVVILPAVILVTGVSVITRRRRLH